MLRPEDGTPWVEGRQDLRVAALLDGAPADRAFALACLSLANPAVLDAAAREALYERMARRVRRDVLAELAGVPVVPAAVGALARVEASDFTADDWRLLFSVLSRADAAKTLGHVAALTPILVRQYDAIPVELRSPRLLAVAAKTRVSDERWRRLGETLDRLPGDVRTSLVRAGQGVSGVGELWDFHFRCRQAFEDASPFPVAHPNLGSSFRPVSTPEAMRREGREMANCMAQRITHVVAERAVYYRWLGSEAASVELLRLSDDRWSTGAMVGRNNSRLDTGTQEAILRAIELALGDALVVGGDAAEIDPPRAAGIVAAQDVGRARFSAAEVAAVTAALRQIRGRSIADYDDAFCVFELSSGPYVQFLVRRDMRYLAEISSHHYLPVVEAHLDEAAVSFLEDCHFDWPLSQANFVGSLPCRNDEDCEPIAAFALGVLALMFGHTSGARVDIQINVP